MSTDWATGAFMFSSKVSAVSYRPVTRPLAVLTKTKVPVVELHEVPVDGKRVERTNRIVERVWRAIEAGTFYPAPSPQQCSSCAFREPCRRW